MPSTLSRRTLLRGIGTSVALPMMNAMSPTRLLSAAASDEEAPLRMAFLYVPNGMHMADWTPDQDGADYAITPTLAGIEKHRKSFNVLTGLTLDGARAHGDGGGDHARSVAAFLTGAHPRKTNGTDIQNGVSIDQVTAEQIGKATRFSSLEFCLLYTSPSPRDRTRSRMPSSA